MFRIKFKIRGKLLALVLGVSLAFIIVVIWANSIALTIILAIFMFFFLRLAKGYAVAKEEVDRVMPKKVYLDAKFDSLWEPVPWTVSDENGVVCNTELLDQTCDCDEFRDFHGHYPVGDFRRICRHMVKAYVDSGRLGNLTDAAQFVVGEAYKKGEGASWREILVSGLGSNPSLFYYDEEPNVVGLIYKDGKDGVYEEFRFNLNDKTWENDFKPAYTSYMEQTLAGWRTMVEREKEKTAQKAVKMLD